MRNSISENTVNVNTQNRDYKAFHVISLRKGEDLTRPLMSVSVLVFVYSGCISIQINDENVIRKIDEKNILLVTIGCKVRVKALDDTLLMSCHFDSNERIVQRKFMDLLNQEISEDFNYSFKTLIFHPIIDIYIESMIMFLDRQENCLKYHSVKLEELRFYFEEFYPRMELAEFFYPIIASKNDFKEFVLNNYKNIKDVKSFANSANMSVSTFNRKFRETFMESAHKWMKENKNKELLKDILMTEIPYLELALKYHFSSLSYLISFCKQQYGKTPKELREKGLKE